MGFTLGVVPSVGLTTVRTCVRHNNIVRVVSRPQTSSCSDLLRTPPLSLAPFHFQGSTSMSPPGERLHSRATASNTEACGLLPPLQLQALETGSWVHSFLRQESLVGAGPSLDAGRLRSQGRSSADGQSRWDRVAGDAIFDIRGQTADSASSDGEVT